MIIWQLDKNFWEVNSIMELYFKDIKEEDKSKDKAVSSLKMWCIALSGAESSPAKNLSKEELDIMIFDSFLKEKDREIELILEDNNIKKPKKSSQNANKGSNKESYKDKYSFIFDSELDKPYVNKMIDVSHPKTKKILRKWESKLEEWHDFIDKTTIDEGTYDMIGKMMAQSHKMWTDYFRIKKEADAETEQQVIGGQEESFLESEWS